MSTNQDEVLPQDIDQQSVEDSAPKIPAGVKKLLKLQASKNIAADMDESELCKIGQRVCEETKYDDDSRDEWLTIMKEGMKIAKQTYEKKSEPWEGAANIKVPLITNGAITYASRELPQLVRQDKVVEAAVIGLDNDASFQQRATRVSKYMSWQLLVQNEDWKDETDKLLHMLPVVGTVFRKSFWNPILDRPDTELISPENIIINNNVKSLKKARRITHRTYIYKNDIVERVRLGLFTYMDEDEINKLEEGTTGDGEQIQSLSDESRDSDSPYEILEQHTFLDLDEDGYKEPYIITVLARTQKVLRIVSRWQDKDVKYIDDTSDKIKYIKPDQYFTDFHFFPSPDGTYYSLGFGVLLYPLNHAINMVTNQLIDSGTLLNAHPTFIGSSCRIKKGDLYYKPGKLTAVEGVGGKDLASNIYPLPLNEPSKILYDLLVYLVNFGKELASVSEILAGDMPTQNSPATSVLALIKQGLTQYNACHARTLNGFQREFKKLYLLNCRNLDVNLYIKVMNDPLATAADFTEDDFHVRPVADPNMSSDAIRLATAQAVAQMPIVDKTAATRLMLDAMNVPLSIIQQLLPNNPPTPPEILKIQAEVAELQAKAQNYKLDHINKAADFELRHKQFNLQAAEQQRKNKETDSQIKLNAATAVNELMGAGAEVQNADTALKKLHVDAMDKALTHLEGTDSMAGTSLRTTQSTLSNMQEAIPDATGQTVNQQGGANPIPGMATPPSDPSSSPMAPTGAAGQDPTSN